MNPDKWSSTVKYTRTVIQFTCAVYTVSCVLIQLIRDVPKVSFVQSTTQSTLTLFSPSHLVLLNVLAHSLGFYCAHLLPFLIFPWQLHIWHHYVNNTTLKCANYEVLHCVSFFAVQSNLLAYVRIFSSSHCPQTVSIYVFFCEESIFNNHTKKQWREENIVKYIKA